MNATPSISVFMTQLGRLISVLLGERAHVQIIITLKDGSPQLVHVNRSYLPSDLPKV